LCCWHGNALLFKGEEKPHGGSIDAAATDLISKAFAGHWNTLVFGALPFIMCFAAAGHVIQFYMIKRNSTMLDPILGQLNMLQVGQGVHCASHYSSHFQVKGYRHIAGQVQIFIGSKPQGSGHKWKSVIENPSGKRSLVRLIVCGCLL
jgi:hypothetical protein